MVLVGLKPTFTVQVPRGTAGVALALPAASVALTQVLLTIEKSPASLPPVGLAIALAVMASGA